MFQEIRRQDRKMNDDTAKRLLLESNYGIISLVDDNDYGYGVPLNYVYKNGNIYFHSASTGHKICSIQKNNKASFCVVGDCENIPNKFTMKFESVIVFGKVVEINDIEKKEALVGLVEKYSKNYLKEGKKYINNRLDDTLVLKLVVENICGKSGK